MTKKNAHQKISALDLSQISFVVSSYNGLKLLQKNLPSMIAEAKNGDEILIADDFSTDLTITYFKHQYNLTLREEVEGEYRFWQAEIEIKNDHKKIYLSLLENLRNLRFGANNNLAAKLAKYDLIALLNNDLILEKGWRQKAVAFWRQESLAEPQKPIFAVTVQEKSAQNPDLRRGKNMLGFRRGRFQHQADPELSAGETAWACGGSSLFDRRIFLEIGGFDARYYPAYWEDIDLSYMAREAGYRILFAPEAIVIHDHETTNQDVFGQEKIEKMSWHNGSKFIWKNSNWKQKLQFLLWSPYWWLKRNQFIFWLIMILLVASFWRFYQLGETPQGLTWDETAIGYNGWAIWETRRDEWLNKLPVSFRSFGDYKAPLAIYLNGAFTHTFGVSPWAIRLPFVLASLASILGLSLLVRFIYRQLKNPLANWLGILTAVILTFSPWHFFYSRVGFECGMANCLIIWGVFCWYYYWQNTPRNRKNIWQKVWLLWLGSGFFVASAYVYHSSKILAPVMMLFLLILFFKKIKFRLAPILTMILLSGLLIFPMIKDGFYGEGLTRAESSFLMNSDLSTGQKINKIFNNYWLQIQPDFIVGGATGGAGLAHGMGKFGVLSWPTLIASLIGFFVGWRQILQKRSSRGVFLLALFWTVFGLLPAVIGDSVPHPNRAFLALPGMVMLAIIGLEALATKNKSPLQSDVILRTFLILEIIFGLAMTKYYFTDFKANSGQAFNAQYLEAFKITTQYAGNSDQVIFTNEYGQAYIFALLTKKINPINWQGGALNKYLFAQEIKTSDLDRSNVLIVAGEKNAEELMATAENRGLTPIAILEDDGGNLRFVIYKTEKIKTNGEEVETETGND